MGWRGRIQAQCPALSKVDCHRSGFFRWPGVEALPTIRASFEYHRLRQMRVWCAFQVVHEEREFNGHLVVLGDI